MNIENLATVSAIAKTMGVNRKTVWDWAHQGLIKSYRVDGITLIDKESVTAFSCRRDNNRADGNKRARSFYPCKPDIFERTYEVLEVSKQ